MFLVLLMSLTLSKAENVTVTDVTVSKDTCFRYFEINSFSTVRLRYSFEDAALDKDCWFRFESRGYKESLCIEIEEYVVPENCNILLQYREWDDDSYPQMVYDCKYKLFVPKDKKVWCSKARLVYVTFKETSNKQSFDGDDMIQLKVYRPESDSQPTYIEKYKYHIIAIMSGIGGVLVIGGIISLLCCRTRKMERIQQQYHSSNSPYPSLTAPHSPEDTQHCPRMSSNDTESTWVPLAPQRYHVGDEPPAYSEIVKEGMEEPPPPYPGK